MRNNPAPNSLTTHVLNEDQVWVTPSLACPDRLWIDLVRPDGRFLAVSVTPEQARKIARDLLETAP